MLPGEIETLEKEQTTLTAKMSGPDYHRESPQTMRDDSKRAGEIEELLLSKFERWEALEEARNK